jgi:hypothetical protein
MTSEVMNVEVPIKTRLKQQVKPIENVFSFPKQIIHR